MYARKQDFLKLLSSKADSAAALSNIRTIRAGWSINQVSKSIDGSHGAFWATFIYTVGRPTQRAMKPAQVDTFEFDDDGLEGELNRSIPYSYERGPYFL